MLKPTLLGTLISNLPILSTSLPAKSESKQRFYSRSPEQQVAAIAAAEAKRLRKQSKRLADAGLTSTELL